MIERKTFTSHAHWGRERGTSIIAIVGMGRVLVSRCRHLVTGNETLRGVPVVSLLWWEQPVRCPSFEKRHRNVDDGLYPILRSQPFAIVNSKLHSQRHCSVFCDINYQLSLF